MEEEESKENPADQIEHFKEPSGSSDASKTAASAPDGKKARTVLFLGPTGSGKVTLVQSMATYLMGTGYDDPFRYRLFNKGVSVIDFDEGVTIIEFPNFDPTTKVSYESSIFFFLLSAHRLPC